jgi:hypothetical protein
MEIYCLYNVKERFLLYAKPYFTFIYTQMLTTEWFNHPYYTK